MSLYNYVDMPNNNLVCCICRTPFTDPITTLTCIHTFCRECIHRALSHAPQCPVDRSPLNINDLGPANPIVRSLVDELIVECVHREEGCGYNGQRQVLAIHLREECRFSEERNNKSEEVGVAKNQITEGVGQAKESNATGETGDSVSSAKDITPTTASSSIASNLQPNPRANESPCLHTHPRITHLTEQNILLRHRVDNLENAMLVLKKEMSAVRSVLGPWFRNEYVASTWHGNLNTNTNTRFGNDSMHRTSNQRDEPVYTQDYPPVPAVSNNGRPGSTGANVVINTNEVIDGNGRAVGVDDLASYFPADDEVRAQTHPPQPGMSQRHNRSLPSNAGTGMLDSLSNSMGYAYPYQGSFGFAGGYTSPMGGVPTLSNSYASASVGSSSSTITGASPSSSSGPPPLNQSLSSTIPPFSTDTPLEHTLHSLHNGVVVVASALDRFAMKSEVGLGSAVGEVLRLGEEVMGVRASVHGLRMQMHGMLMERSGGMGMGMMGGGGFGRTSGTGSEEGVGNGGGGIQWPSGVVANGGPLLNQRMFYPANGITKL